MHITCAAESDETTQQNILGSYNLTHIGTTLRIGRGPRNSQLINASSNPNTVFAATSGDYK